MNANIPNLTCCNYLQLLPVLVSRKVGQRLRQLKGLHALNEVFVVELLHPHLTLVACRQPTHNTEQCSLSSRKSIETTIISGSWSDFEIFSFTTMPNRFQIHGLFRHEILHGQSLGNALASHGPATPGSHWFQMCLSKAHQVLCLCTLYSRSTCLYIIYSIICIYICIES